MQCDVERLEKHHHYDNFIQYENLNLRSAVCRIESTLSEWGGSHLGSPALDELCDFGDMQPAQVEVM